MSNKMPHGAGTAPTIRPGGPAVRLLEGQSHAILLVDAAGRIEGANPRAAALLDRAESALAGAPLASLLPPAAKEDTTRALAEAVRGEAADDVETALGSPEGAGTLVGLTFVHLPGENGARALVLARDLTRVRRARDEATREEASRFLDAAAEHHREAAEFRSAAETNRKLTDLGKLVSGIAHELRTPLTFVTNLMEVQRQRIETLQATRPDLALALAEARDLNATALTGIERVARLVRDLRPLTKNKPHRTTRMDLAELAVEATRVFRGSHEGKTAVELDLESTHVLEIDREDMLNVLTNLLNNAAEAMDGRGRILLQTRNRHAPPEIRVIDEGPGVDPALRERIFEPFFTTKADGTGLGLFIARRTVEAHGGTLACEGGPGGRGATFRVRLPCPPER